MPSIIFITHPEVVIDPLRPIPEWPLSEIGRARMERFARMVKDRNVSAVFASHERKAMDGAEIVATALGLSYGVVDGLEENGRESTGYIAPPEFWEVVAEFFGNPTRSVRGWERAVDAQSRIIKAVSAIAEGEPADGDLVIVSHGAVGCLLTAHLQGVAIGQETRPPHLGGGCFLVLDRDPLALREDWRAIEDGFAGGR